MTVPRVSSYDRPTAENACDEVVPITAELLSIIPEVTLLQEYHLSTIYNLNNRTLFIRLPPVQFRTFTHQTLMPGKVVFIKETVELRFGLR